MPSTSPERGRGDAGAPGRRRGGPAGDDPRRREADAILARVERDATAIGESHAGRVAAHFAAADASAEDRIEVWGRRIGRALSLIGVVVLLAVLAATYL